MASCARPPAAHTPHARTHARTHACTHARTPRTRDARRGLLHSAPLCSTLLHSAPLCSSAQVNDCPTHLPAGSCEPGSYVTREQWGMVGDLAHYLTLTLTLTLTPNNPYP